MSDLFWSIGLGAVFGGVVNVFSNSMKKIQKKSNENVEIYTIQEYSEQLFQQLSYLNQLCDGVEQQTYFLNLHKCVIKLLVMQKYMFKLPRQDNSTVRWLQHAVLYNSKGLLLLSKLKIALRHLNPEKQKKVDEAMETIKKTLNDCLHNVQLDTNVLMER